MKDWKKTIIKESFTIQETALNLSESNLKISLVLDEGGRLIGTVTDGDIRRGLISGSRPEDSIENIYKKNPIYADKNHSDAKLIEILDKYKIDHIPITSKDKKVIGLKTRSSLIYENYKELDNTLVIMAGGFGKRLGKLTSNLPKPMLPIGGKPIIEHIISRAKNQGISDFIISTHYLAEHIEDYFGNGADFGVRINYIKEKEPLGTAGALAFISKDLESPIFITNGDVVSKIDYRDFLYFHQDNQSDLTFSVTYHQEQNPFGVVEVDGNKITNIVEKPVYKSLISAGIYLINPEIIKFIKKGNPYTMPELAIKSIENEKKVLAYSLFEEWQDIGKKEDYIQAMKAESENW